MSLIRYVILFFYEYKSSLLGETLQRINTSLFTRRSFFYAQITGNRLEMLLLYADNCVPLLVFGKRTRGDTSSIKGLHS